LPAEPGKTARFDLNLKDGASLGRPVLVAGAGREAARRGGKGGLGSDGGGHETEAEAEWGQTPSGRKRCGNPVFARNPPPSRLSPRIRRGKASP
jgi:hypothetical protein